MESVVIVYDATGMKLPGAIALSRAVEMVNGGRALEVERVDGHLVAIKKLPGMPAIQTINDELPYEDVLRSITELASQYTALIAEARTSQPETVPQLFSACVRKLSHTLNQLKSKI